MGAGRQVNGQAVGSWVEACAWPCHHTGLWSIKEWSEGKVEVQDEGSQVGESMASGSVVRQGAPHGPVCRGRRDGRWPHY